MVDPEVTGIMIPYFSKDFGNPNSLHIFGSKVHESLEIAMNKLYSCIGAGEEDDIVVNGCATEGNNTVLKGVYFDYLAGSKKNHIITTRLEHPSVTNTCRFLETIGFQVTYLAPEDQQVYGNAAAWDEMKLKVAQFLEGLGPHD
ncbi:MAG: aminotransferase class V-fold PLP-dependent enzyme [Oligoflexales bacterium]|nr:aminotransferase class V-fold PLP-dependent enzyme [Oligoflexales bacterium]